MFMTGVLTLVNWANVQAFTATVIKSDTRLSDFLNSPTGRAEHSNETFGQWVMAYHPTKNLDKSYFNGFLTPISETTLECAFDLNVAAIFHDLLLSSLYAYLCLLKWLKFFIKNLKEDDENFKKCVGQFSVAVRLFYLVSHSHVMKAYFTVRHPLLTIPSYEGSFYHRNMVNTHINDVITKVKWDWVESMPENDGGGVSGVEDSSSHDNFIEDSIKNGTGLSYRRSYMSFVDHYAGIRLLERRSSNIPPHVLIKLCLVAVKHPTLRYLPWDDMEKIIHDTCQKFSSDSESIKLEGQDVISKIKKILDGIENYDDNDVIRAFKTLLKYKNFVPKNALYPSFPACIHCESSLAAILSQLHCVLSDSDLHTLFQACPSLPPSSLTP